jgi:hypothetical protein
MHIIKPKYLINFGDFPLVEQIGPKGFMTEKWPWWGGKRECEVAQIMYKHVRKCKNDKIKEKNSRKKI